MKDIVNAMRQLPRDEVPGTAVYFGVPVIGKDGRICASAMQTV